MTWYVCIVFLNLLLLLLYIYIQVENGQVRKLFNIKKETDWFNAFCVKPIWESKVKHHGKNAQKFKELGLEQIAQQLMDSLTARTKGKQNDNNVDNDNQDYQPADLNDQDYQPVDDDDHDSDEENSNVLKKAAPASSSRSLPNKVLWNALEFMLLYIYTQYFLLLVLIILYVIFVEGKN